MHTVPNKVIAKNTTLDWQRGQGGESVEEKEAGRVREAKEEGAGSGILKVAGSGEIGKITQHSAVFCY